MSNVSLSIVAACSHSWISNSNSMLPCKILKAFAAGVKALFGKYKVTITTQTERLIQQYHESYFAMAVRHLLSRNVQQVTPYMNVGLNYFSESPPAYTETPVYTTPGFGMPNEKGELPPSYEEAVSNTQQPSMPNEIGELPPPPPPYEEAVSNTQQPSMPNEIGELPPSYEESVRNTQQPSMPNC